MENKVKEDIIDLIKEDKLEQAFQILSHFSKESNDHPSEYLANLATRLARLIAFSKIGIINSTLYEVERNEVRDELVEFVRKTDQIFPNERVLINTKRFGNEVSNEFTSYESTPIKKFGLETNTENSKQVNFSLIIEGDFDMISHSKIDSIVEKLRLITGDSRIDWIDVEKGSIEIKIKAEMETIVKLIKLLDENRLSHLIGEEIKGLKLDIKVQKEHEYDVALSFAGEDRNYVQKVAEELQKKKLRIFYDEFEKANLWGKDLYQYLNDVYKNKSKFTIVFISKHYSEKRWTNHELKSIQSRVFKENIEYLLPVKLDNTELPGLNDTIAFMNGKNHSPEEIASLTFEKLQLL